jgi:hypothetical protein
MNRSRHHALTKTAYANAEITCGPNKRSKSGGQSPPIRLFGPRALPGTSAHPITDTDGSVLRDVHACRRIRRESNKFAASRLVSLSRSSAQSRHTPHNQLSNRHAKPILGRSASALEHACTATAVAAIPPSARKIVNGSDVANSIPGGRASGPYLQADRYRRTVDLSKNIVRQIAHEINIHHSFDMTGQAWQRFEPGQHGRWLVAPDHNSPESS